jgi:DNA-binding XRE family transcriptional regulator
MKLILDTIKGMAPKRTNEPNKKLIALRDTLGLTQTDMAKKLGVKLRTYQNYEGGLTIPEPVQILISLIKQARY